VSTSTPVPELTSPGDSPEPSRWHTMLQEIVRSNWLVTTLSVVLAVLVGSVLIVATDPEVQAATDVGSWFGAVWQAISGAYVALFQGAIYDFRRPDFASAIRPFTQTLAFATPLIAAALGIAIGFRVGLFNIGGRGQMLVGAAFGGFAGFQWDLPPVIHIIVAVGMAILGGALSGWHRGLPQGANGRARGDRHDHAQLHRPVSRRVSAHDTRASSSRHDQPEVTTDARHCDPASPAR